MFHKIMEFKLKGADTYYNHGSTWIILTDKKQWVIELTKDGTLWYNYYFFQSILIGLMGFEDTVKNQNYITEWVENFIQNGVKDTYDTEFMPKVMVDDTIQNGVKHTEYGDWLDGDERLDDIIQNGVKETKHNPIEDSLAMEEVIQNGVKKTFGQKMKPILLGDIIKNGVKETWGYEKQPQVRVNEVIRGEIKEINWRRVDNHPTYLDNIINSTKL